MSTKEPRIPSVKEYIWEKYPSAREYVIAKKENLSRTARNLKFYPRSEKWFKSGLERIGAVLSGHPELADRTPVLPLLLGQPAMQVFNISLGDMYSDAELMANTLSAAKEMYDIVPLFFILYADYWCEDYGGKVEWPHGRYMSAPAIQEYPIKTAEDVEKLHIWDVDEMPKKSPSHIYHMMGQRTLQKKLGPAFMALAFPYGMFTVAGALVYPGTLFLWVMKQPDVVKKLLEKVVENSVNHCEAVAKEFGSAFISTGSVTAGSETMSPEQCREFNVVYLADMVRRSLKAGAGPGIFYHLCGAHEFDWKTHAELCPINESSIFHLAYYGREAADLNDVIPVVGDTCPLLGNVTTELMHLGTPNEVYEEAKRQILAYRHSPKGFMLGVTCETPPLASPANVYALVKASKEIGPLPSKA